jgi:predicted O-methyltransferase YrrM
LYRTVKTHKPRRALEIGLAAGTSSLSMLTALEENGQGGTLTSIDPFQSTNWRSWGTHHVKAAGFQDQHRLIEELDYLALPKLVAAGEQFDLIYIDGNHDFEYVVLDFFFADLLLPQGGIVGFNDCGWRTVHAAMRHIPPADRYEEIDVGLKKDYRGRNFAISMERWCTGRSSADRYFRKK